MNCKIIRIPGAEVSIEFQSRQDNKVQGLIKELHNYPNLHNANRAGIDIPCFAGTCAAGAFLTGSRQRSDREAPLNYLLNRLPPRLVGLDHSPVD